MNTNNTTGIRCPQCEELLIVAREKVFICPRGHGLWFNSHSDFIEFVEVERTKQTRNIKIGIKPESQRWLKSSALGELRCPHDHGLITPRQYRPPVYAFSYDECLQCSGVWVEAADIEGLSRVIKNVSWEEDIRAQEAAITKKQAIQALELKTEIAKARHMHPSMALSYWYGFQGLSGWLPIPLYNIDREPGVPVVLASIIILNTVLLFLAPYGSALSSAGVFVADLFWRGEYWRIITYMFMHAGLGHLLANVYFLWIFGDTIERVLGKLRFAAIYWISGILSVAVWSLLAPMEHSVPLLGASGAVAGIMGASFVFNPYHRIRSFWFGRKVTIPAWIYIVAWASIQLIYTLSPEQPGIAYAGHVGGFLAGISVGHLFKGKIRGPKAQPPPLLIISKGENTG